MAVLRNRKTEYFDEEFKYKGEIIKIQQGKQGAYVEILNKMIEQLDCSIKIHKRVLVHRFDLHPNYYSDDNKVLSRFINRIKQEIFRKYGILNIGHGWAREQERSKKQHYHLVIFLDGNKIRHPKKLNTLIKAKWAAYGHMPVISKPYKYIDKYNLKEARREVIYRISYLAKVRGKGYRDPQAKDYGSSKLIRMPLVLSIGTLEEN
jgi:hypothetical protein